MIIDDFKSGKLIEVDSYKAFSPNLINHNYIFQNSDLTDLIEEATLKLGSLSAYAELVPDVSVFIRMYTSIEATVSSKIEGTQTSIEDVLVEEKHIALEKRDDRHEVMNYIKAMNEAIEKMKTLPLSSRLLKETHYILMQGVRGETKNPGEFRKSQNWIGGASLRDAGFIPPVWHEVEKLMGDLENFIHNRNLHIPHVVRIAIAHYQFETIHPFLDGNGRIGRLMIPLYFIQEKVLPCPILYLSVFFEKHKSLYYDKLTRVRTHNELMSWLLFFIQGIVETTSQSIQNLKDVLALKKNCEEVRIVLLGRKMSHAKILLDYLFKSIYIDAEDAARETGLSLVSSYSLIRDFEKLGILKEYTGLQRGRFWLFDEYIKIFKGD
ncbi:MAG: Fic family protein [Bacteroidia bacterium]